MNDDIIKRLIKLDHEQQEIIESAKNKKDNVQRDARIIENQIFEEFEMHQQNDLFAYQEELNSFKTSKINEYKSNCQHKCDELEKAFNENKDVWIQEILKEIITNK